MQIGDYLLIVKKYVAGGIRIIQMIRRGITKNGWEPPIDI